MDPNANIAEQRQLAAYINDCVSRRERPVDHHVERLAELVQALDDWRQRGGFDPYNAKEDR